MNNVNLEYRKNIIDTYNIKNPNILVNLLEGNVVDKIEEMQYITKGDVGSIYTLQLDLNTICILKMYNMKLKNVHAKIIKDIVIHNKIKKLILNDICPHFIYYYYSNLLTSNLLLKENINYNIESVKIDNLFLIMEYCDGTLVDFLNDIYSAEHYESMYFQIYYATLCLHNVLRLFHNDLHVYNIMYKNIDKNIVFNYNINGKNYYIPTFGHLFLIIDFERSVFVDMIEDIEEKKKAENKLNTNFDFNKLKNIHYRPIKIILKKHNVADIKGILNNVYTNVKITVQEYINKNSKLFDDSTLYDKILHYVIDNNYLDLSKFVDNGKYKKLNEIITLLKNMTQNIFLSTDSPEVILNKNFNKYQNKINFDKTFKLF